jgi:aspartyl-tRNA(Asn)/glutamyl-tRNA(Gln) amidotransferase subunit B
VLFNPDTGETRAMRTKEDAADYRYFPDPDLPPLVIAPEWIEHVRSEMTELPRVMAARFVADYGLTEYDATGLTQSKAMASYFEATAKSCGQPKLASNWIMGEVSRRLNAEQLDIAACPVKASPLGTLIARIADGTISNNAAKQVFEELWAAGMPRNHTIQVSGGISFSGTAPIAFVSVDAIIEAKGLKQMSDTSALEKIVDQVLAANPKNVAEYKAGNSKALNALVGQIMKASGGKANPQQVNDLLRAKLV